MNKYTVYAEAKIKITTKIESETALQVSEKIKEIIKSLPVDEIEIGPIQVQASSLAE